MENCQSNSVRKKAGNDNLSNLRPISILSCISKAFELLLKEQILDFERPI